MIEPDLLHDAACRAVDYLAGLEYRSVAPQPAAVAALEALAIPLPSAPSDPRRTLQLLDELGSPATMAMAGSRFFGFVIGGALPVALAANWLAGAWDQNSAFHQATPGTAVLEKVALHWLLELFRLPPTCTGAFVTGATVANLCALAAARHALLTRAGCWATDAHKWLNVPYDCGIALVRDPIALQAAMAITAEYLPLAGQDRNPSDFTPELSRRARGVEVWAALHALGRTGVAELIESNCALARRFADGLAAAGFEILNEVALNQVLVAFGDAEQTKRTITKLQAAGVCWAGITVWQGRTAMRISVSSWATTTADVDRSVQAMITAAH